MNASRQRLLHHLQLAQHRVQKEANRLLLDTAGVTMPQAALLVILRSEGPVPQKIVASRLGINESAVTAMVTRMSSLGLVIRRADPQDGRARRLALTAKGRRALEAARAPLGEINSRLDNALVDEQMEALVAGLHRIANAFAPTD